MTEQPDPMQMVYDEIDDVIREAGADDPDLFFELSRAWSRNPLVMDHIRFRLGPTTAQFDAHMVGEKVHGHTAKAETVASLLTGITEASKEIAKVSMGVASLRNEYLVHGILPGSVRLLIEAPDRTAKERPGSVEPSRPALREAFHQPSEESNALRSLAHVLTAAQPSLGPGKLADLVQHMPTAARAPLKTVAETVTRSGIELSGEVREREVKPVQMTFTPDRAVHLTSVIDRLPVPPRSVTREGLLDGFRKSSRTIYLAPESGPSISVTVPDEEVLATVAALATNSEQYVRFKFTEKVVEGVPSRNNRGARVLDWITPIPAPTERADQLEVDLDTDG